MDNNVKNIADSDNLSTKVSIAGQEKQLQINWDLVQKYLKGGDTPNIFEKLLNNNDCQWVWRSMSPHEPSIWDYVALILRWFSRKPSDEFITGALFEKNGLMWPFVALGDKTYLKENINTPGVKKATLGGKLPRLILQRIFSNQPDKAPRVDKIGNAEKAIEIAMQYLCRFGKKLYSLAQKVYNPSKPVFCMKQPEIEKNDIRLMVVHVMADGLFLNSSSCGDMPEIMYPLLDYTRHENELIKLITKTNPAIISLIKVDHFHSIVNKLEHYQGVWRPDVNTPIRIERRFDKEMIALLDDIKNLAGRRASLHKKGNTKAATECYDKMASIVKDPYKGKRTAAHGDVKNYNGICDGISLFWNMKQFFKVKYR